MITRQEIEKIASLAKIDIDENDIPKLTKELSSILSFVENINELDLTNIKPTAHAVELQNVFREDNVKPTNIIEQVINKAPESEENFFTVPKVI